MNVETILFISFGVIALVAAIAMIFTRNMVYSALYMVIVFLALALIYLLYQAPFVAFVQITMYAGGIMVLVLFVIMMIGAEKMSHTENIRWQRPLAFGLATILVGEATFLAFQEYRLPSSIKVSSGFGGPQEIGLILFNKYLLPFEIISILLLVAMVGAVVLTRQKDKKR